MSLVEDLRGLKGLPREERARLRDEKVARYLAPRERITERTETIREETIVRPVELDEAARTRIAALERDAAENAATIAYLLEPGDVEAIPPPPPEVSLPGEGAADESGDDNSVEIGPQEAEQIITGFIGELREGREVAEDTMRSMASADRKKLFSLLNGELGRLQNEEALLGKSIPRRADVDSLLGILARVGEA
jgi:hypothetical protein